MRTTERNRPRQLAAGQAELPLATTPEDEQRTRDERHRARIQRQRDGLARAERDAAERDANRVCTYGRWSISSDAKGPYIYHPDHARVWRLPRGYATAPAGIQADARDAMRDTTNGGPPRRIVDRLAKIVTSDRP